MKNPSNHRLESLYTTVALPKEALSIDGSDIAMGIVQINPSQHFVHRIAQMGVIQHANAYEITCLQGPGPTKKLRRRGLTGEELLDEFKKTTQIKPINSLVAALAILEKERGKLSEIFFNPNKKNQKAKLNYETVLKALKFKEDPNGLFRLDLEKPSDEILKRVTGKSTEKNDSFEYFLTDLRSKVEGCLINS